MTSINAGTAYYRVQNSLDVNKKNLSKNLQKLASGSDHVSGGDRSASTQLGYGMKTELQNIKAGVKTATEVLSALEVVNSGLQRLKGMLARGEELVALATNGLNNFQDMSAINAEAIVLSDEINGFQARLLWKGVGIIGGDREIGFSRNAGSAFTLNVGTSIDAWDMMNFWPNMRAVPNLVALASELQNLHSAANVMIISTGAKYNEMSNRLNHMTALKAGFDQALSSMTEVDFADKTMALAKNQILNKAGVAMLAQANSQREGFLDLLL